MHRDNLIENSGVVRTGTAPKFSNSDNIIDHEISESGKYSRCILKEIGYSNEYIDELSSRAIVYCRE